VRSIQARQACSSRAIAPQSPHVAQARHRHHDDIVSKMGMTSPARLQEHLAAIDIRFTSDEPGSTR
jgi:hypothetical protein